MNERYLKSSDNKKLSVRGSVIEVAYEVNCPFRDRINELEDEVAILLEEIEELKEVIKENKEMILSLSRSHASLLRMNEILAEKLMEKHKKLSP